MLPVRALPHTRGQSAPVRFVSRETTPSARPAERGFRHRWLRATRCRRSTKRRPQRWYRRPLLRRVGESRDWGPDLSTEACSRADLVPLLDESAWRSGVAFPRRPPRRHISRGPVPRSQTSASPPHSGTLSQLPRGVPAAVRRIRDRVLLDNPCLHPRATALPSTSPAEHADPSRLHLRPGGRQRPAAPIRVPLPCAP